MEIQPKVHGGISASEFPLSGGSSLLSAGGSALFANAANQSGLGDGSSSVPTDADNDNSSKPSTSLLFIAPKEKKLSFEDYWASRGMSSPDRNANIPFDDTLTEMDTPRNWKVRPTSPSAKRVAKIATDRRHQFAKSSDSTITAHAPEYKPVAPSRFLDKVEFLMQLEAKRKKFKDETMDSEFWRSMMLPDVDFRELLDPRSKDEIEQELRVAEEQAKFENRVMARWELLNDRTLYNTKTEENFAAGRYGEALNYSRLYRSKCEAEKMQMALEREEEILRLMGANFHIGAGTKGGSRKYKTPNELHMDLYQLKVRNSKETVASLNARPTGKKLQRVGEKKKSTTNKLKKRNPFSEINFKRPNSVLRLNKSKSETKKLLDEVKKSMLKVKRQGIKLPSTMQKKKTLRAINFNSCRTSVGAKGPSKKGQGKKKRGARKVTLRKKRPARKLDNR
jgi:hypothetical protein